MKQRLITGLSMFAFGLLIIYFGGEVEAALKRINPKAKAKENTRRDGSYEYYLSESVRDNDAKGVGPFIWASLEMERMGLK